jgi:hypothetical protein
LPQSVYDGICNIAMKAIRLAVLLSAFGLLGSNALAQAGKAIAGVARLAWDPPAENSPQVVGYVVKWGPKSGQYPNQKDVGKATTVVITKLLLGHTYYFVVGAYYRGKPKPVFTPELAYTVSH